MNTTNTVDVVATIITAHSNGDLGALQTIWNRAIPGPIGRAVHCAILDLTGQDARGLEEMHRNLDEALR